MNNITPSQFSPQSNDNTGCTAGSTKWIRRRGYLLMRPHHLIFGKQVEIPFGQNMVVILPNERVRIYKAGRQNIRNLPIGKYEIYLIDVRSHNTSLLVAAKSADDWEVKLGVDIVWHVAKPAKVINFTNLSYLIQKALREAISDIIQLHLHDELIGSPKRRPLDSRRITSFVMNRISGSQAIQGIGIQRVILTKKLGDPRRTRFLQRINADSMRYEQEEDLLNRSYSFKEKQYEQKSGILDWETLVGQKEERAIWKREIEKEHGRLETYQIRAKVEELQRQIDSQKIEIEKLRKAQDIDVQLTKESWKHQADVEIARAKGRAEMFMAQGPMANMDRETLVALAAMDRDSSQNLAHTPHEEHILGYKEKKPEFRQQTSSPNGNNVHDHGTNNSRYPA